MAVKSVEKDFLTYPISLKYGAKDWNITSALREFLSNMLDTETGYSFNHDGKFAYIEDEGNGLPRKSFIMGESTRNGEQMGQFGEGLKMGLITLLREKRFVEVSTVGFDIQVEAVSLDELYRNGENLLDHLNEGATPEEVKENEDTKIMKLTFTPNQRKIGTLIKVQCSEKELEDAVSLFLKLREPQRIDEGIYLPGGNIYILGLRTATMPNMLFSYNIQDKSMTNRDRNIVAQDKLQANIVNVLKRAKNQKFIQTILSSFQTNITAYEYQLAFTPMYPEAWKKAVEKLYPKACLSSDIKGDLTAHVMGYTVLRNVPHHLLQIFRQLGLKDSSVYAAQYKGEGLEKKNKIVYPIADTYVSEWTRVDAIREFIANALDAGEPVLRYNGDEARISDSGEGIMKKNMVFGGTSKTNDQHVIGKFGEGLKVACLVLARTNSPVKIETVGTTYTAKLEHFEEFESNLLVIEYVKNSRTKGSSIVFSCEEEELNSAKNRFIQFQGIRKKPALIENIEVYTEGEGRVYVNGLETAKKTGIFNYNILDKNIINSRDRNSVDDSRLRNWIMNALMRTTDENVIETFLRMWREKPRSIEYEINFSPFTGNMTVWAKLVKKIFSKVAFICTTWDDKDSNFITAQAGFELLQNVPTSLRYILEKSGIQTAEKVAQKHRGKGIELEDKIVYPISGDYGRNWTLPMALKEIIANALDADAQAKVTFDDSRNITLISDKGEGISAKHLLFGETSKSSKDNNIGFFGEGLKMAALVAARNKKTFIVMTKGMRYEAKLERDTRFNADVLVIHLQPSRKRIGTDIEFGSTKDEHQKAKNNFLVFNNAYKQIEGSFYKAARANTGSLFVNGCFVNNYNMLYSYDLNAKDMMNRDRTSVDDPKFRAELAKQWALVKNKDIIETYLTCKDDDKIELQISFRPVSTVLSTWKAVMKKLYDKHCFACGTDHDGVARDKGYKILEWVPDKVAEILRYLGMKSSSEVVTLRGDEKDIKKRATESELTALGKRRFQKARKIYETLYGARIAKKIELVSEFGDAHSPDTLGLYNPETDMVYLLIDMFNNDKAHPFFKVLGVMIHEHLHRKTGAHDRTREFEYGLTMELGRLAEMLDLA